MIGKYDRKAMKEELIKRTQESDERKEGEATLRYFKDALDLVLAKFGPTKDEPHILDIIPFKAGDKMPDFMKLKEGKDAYYLDIYVHTNIGPGKVWIVCPSRNYGEPCPICEYIDELDKAGKEYEDYQDIYAKRRCVYNIINQSTVKDAKKGIQIWEASHKYTEKPIQAAAKNPRGGGSIPFSHPDKEVGQSISFSVENDTYRTISGHKLIPRDYDITDDILDQAYKLDQIINILSYREINKIFGKSTVEPELGDEPDPEENIQEKETQEEKKEARKPISKKNQCPADKGVFGEDIDRIADCENCSVYQECAKQADIIEEEKKKARAEKARINRRS